MKKTLVLASATLILALSLGCDEKEDETCTVVSTNRFGGNEISVRSNWGQHPNLNGIFEVLTEEPMTNGQKVIVKNILVKGTFGTEIKLLAVPIKSVQLESTSSH